MFKFLFISGKKSRLNLNQEFLTKCCVCHSLEGVFILFYSTFILQDAVTQEELIVLSIDSKFLVNTRNNDINNI
jgi:hypothetical protein